MEDTLLLSSERPSPEEQQSFSIAGIHDVLEEFHNLCYLLLKKHKHYGGVFWKFEKYAKEIEFSKMRLARLLAEVEASLPYLEKNPELAAYLLNKEHFLNNLAYPLYEDPAKFYDEYKALLDNLKNTVYEQLKNVLHVDKHKRTDNVVTAMTHINQANKMARFQSEHDFNVNTWNPYKGTHTDEVRCRYLRIEGDSQVVDVFERRVRVNVNAVRGSAQERTRQGLTWLPAAVAAVSEGIIGDTFRYFVGAGVGVSIPLFQALIIAVVAKGALNNLTQNIWLKRTRRLENKSDNPVSNSEGMRRLRVETTSSSQMEQALRVSDPTQFSYVGFHETPVRAGEHTLRQQLLDYAKILAGAIRLATDNLFGGSQSMNLISASKNITLSGMDFDSKDLMRTLNFRIDRLNTAINHPHREVEQTDEERVMGEVNSLINRESVSADLLMIKLDELERSVLGQPGYQSGYHAQVSVSSGIIFGRGYQSE